MIDDDLEEALITATHVRRAFDVLFDALLSDNLATDVATPARHFMEMVHRARGMSIVVQRPTLKIKLEVNL